MLTVGGVMGLVLVPELSWLGPTGIDAGMGTEEVRALAAATTAVCV